MTVTLPETRGAKIKYDFESMKEGSYTIVDSKKEAVSMNAAAWKRGFRLARRTIDGEIRMYFMGKR